MSDPPIRRVAIVMLTAVGDVVHVLPVASSIKFASPETHITWIVQPGPHGLVKGHPAIDEFILFDRSRGWKAFRDLRTTLRGREFDLVLALQVYLKAGLVTALLRSPRKLGFDRKRARDLNWLFTTERIPARGQRHSQDQYLEFLDHLGIPARLEWGLEPSAEERERYADLVPASDAPLAALVVGTSKREKEWPVERYAELVDRLYDELGVGTMLVGGRSPREMAAADALRRLARHPPHDRLEWDLRRLVYLIDRADVLVTPDTGPLHIGVALGTPTVALLGYTNPKRFGPYRRFADLLVDAFGNSGEDYSSAAGHRRGRMARISVEQVVAKVRLALERYPRLRGSGQAVP